MVLGAFSFATMSSLVHAIGVTGRYDWQVIAMARTFLAMIFAAGLATASGATLVFFRPRVLWMRSIAGSLALVSGFYSLTKLPVAEVLTLTNMFPIWVAVLSWPLLRVRPTRDVWIAVACGAAGVIVMQYDPRPPIAAPIDAPVTNKYVWVIASASSLFSAFALIGLHQLHRIDARAVVAHFSAVSLAFCVAAMFVFPHRPAEEYVFDANSLLMLLGVGVTATIGQILLTKAFTTGNPAKISVVGLSQVAFGMLFDVWFFDQSFRSRTLVGIALIVTPSAWLLLRRGRPLPPPAD